MKTEQDQPAHPTMEQGSDSVGLPCIYTTPGLTKREYFAGLAMQGLLHNFRDNGMYEHSKSHPMVSKESVRCADSLIAELNKETT